MSSTAQQGAPATESRKKSGFRKIIARVKNAMKLGRKGRQSTREPATVAEPSQTNEPVTVHSVVADPSPPPASPPRSPVYPPAQEDASSAAPAEPFLVAATSTEAAATTRYKDARGQSSSATLVTKVPKARIRAERINLLGGRQGLNFDSTKRGSSEGYVLRTQRPVRMRVPHRKPASHKPKRRTEAEREESRRHRAVLLKEHAEKARIVVDWNAAPVKTIAVRVRRPDGREVCLRQPRMRVRRHCCECNALYRGTGKICGNCQHLRCTECPRRPSKQDKYPYGYPGDALGEHSVPYHECLDCKFVFTPSDSNTSPCPRCSHSRSVRITPRKVEPTFDVTWEQLQQELQNIHLEGLRDA